MTKNNQMSFNFSTNDVYSVDWVHSAKYTKDWVSNTKRILPPPSFIKEIVSYDSKSGCLYWKYRKDIMMILCNHTYKERINETNQKKAKTINQ